MPASARGLIPVVHPWVDSSRISRDRAVRADTCPVGNSGRSDCPLLVAARAGLLRGDVQDDHL